jgi:hypothetical protein
MQIRFGFPREIAIRASWLLMRRDLVVLVPVLLSVEGAGPLRHDFRSNAVENRYHANHPSGPGGHCSEPDTSFLFDDAKTAFRANKNCASAGRYLYEALEHESEEQISRDTFRNAVHEVAQWLSQGEL